MRNLAVWLMIIFFIIGGDNLIQFSKTPLLLRHFVHHYTSHNSTFGEFYLEHYGDKDDDPDDAEEDKALPFKGKTECLTTDLFIIGSHDAPELLTAVIVEFPDKKIILPVTISKEHWQPPQVLFF